MNQYDQNRLTECPEIEPFFYDISPEQAAAGYHATSHSPERAGSLVRHDYAISLLQDRKTALDALNRAIRNGAELSGDPEQLVDAWFPSHRAGLRSRYMAYISAHSNVASSFICGPANFPVARNQKRIDSADRRHDEIGEFRHKSLKRFLKSALPYGDGTSVQTNDPNAVKKLDTKQVQLEATRDMMKAANKAFRKFYKKTDRPEPGTDKYQACIAALVDCGLSELQAKKAIEPNFMGHCVPFESYQLTNINAQIKRLASRAEEVEQTQSAQIDDKFPNGETAYISEDGKIVIEFGYKPDEDTRAKLKSKAFKWSRSRVAWVRKATANALADYSSIIKPMLETE